jgi:D-alanine--D-alanine ligase
VIFLEKILLLCGGCSPERNISLNSARSVFDNIENEFDTEIIFFSKELKKYLINKELLYSNTASDFDFKLKNEGKFLTDAAFSDKLHEFDLIFPVMHGVFAEDGRIQAILEQENVNFTGSSSKQCSLMYNKKNAENFIIKKHEFKSVPKLFIDFEEKDIKNKISLFFEKENLTECVIKPVEGGSSFGVKHAKNLENAVKIAHSMLTDEKKEILIEKRCAGKEFTVIILQNPEGKPVPLIPTEIEVKDSDNIIFDTRRKYLATNETHYYCPPNFGEDASERIRMAVAGLFSLCKARDFLRIDGWILENGEIYFSDFNPISGMEQNSFIFQQSAKIGMTHKEAIKYIMASARRRKNTEPCAEEKKTETIGLNGKKRQVNVLFGGITSERQVSLLSGSNVWLKLMKSEKFSPRPFFLFEENGEKKIILLNYAMVLNHTAEEILYQFKNGNFNYINQADEIRKQLGLEKHEFEKPVLMTLDEFLEKSKNENAFVFIALHGGFGENGEIQSKLEKLGIDFNGSGSNASKLCMNKFETGKIIDDLDLTGVRSAKKKLIDFSSLSNDLKHNLAEFWKNLTRDLGEAIVVKPNCDGCSSGVVVLENENELLRYAELIQENTEIAPESSFARQSEKIVMGKNIQDLIFEEFIETDKINILNSEINFSKKTGWIELTVGILESNGKYHAFNPSITIAESNTVLSVEEKFQGGTGINITPPSESIISTALLGKIKTAAEITAAKIGIKNYCRVDLFANSITNEIIIIEFNTLPALTPSTVLFQQAVKEDPPLYPVQFLETIIK